MATLAGERPVISAMEAASISSRYRDDDLPVQRSELQHKLLNAAHRCVPGNVARAGGADQCWLDLLETDKLHGPAALTDHVGGRRVVGYAESPRLERAPPVEYPEASPQLKMDILPEVTSLVWVRLISGDKPVQHATTLGNRSRVKLLLLREVGTLRAAAPHISIVDAAPTI